MYFGKVKAAAQRRATGRVIVKPSDGTAYGTDSSGFFFVFSSFYFVLVLHKASIL